MGCFGSKDVSKDGVNNAIDAAEFAKRLTDKEPLAICMSANLELFLGECAALQKAEKDGEAQYPTEPQVNDSLDEASEKGLTYDVAQSTVTDFIAFAKKEIALRKWDNSVEAELSGSAGSLSKVSVCIRIGFSEGATDQTYKATFKVYTA